MSCSKTMCWESTDMCSFGERSAITTYFHIVIINRHSFIHSFIHVFINIITLLVVKCQNPSSVRIFLTSLGYLVVPYVFSFLFLLLFRSLVLSFFSSLLSIKILLLIRRPSACSLFLILPVFFFFYSFLFSFFLSGLFPSLLTWSFFSSYQKKATLRCLSVTHF